MSQDSEHGKSGIIGITYIKGYKKAMVVERRSEDTQYISRRKTQNMATVSQMTNQFEWIYIYSLEPLHFSDDSTESSNLKRGPWALMG